MLTLLLLGQAPSPDAVLKRLDQFLANSGAISVNIKARVNGTAVGTGTMRIERPTRMNLTFTTPRGVESITFGSSSVLEIDHGSQTYSEHPYIGRIYPPPFNVTRVLSFVTPQILLRGNSQGQVPKESNPKVTPNVIVDGVATDLVVGKMEGAGGAMEVRMNIDAAGRLLKYYNRTSNPQGVLTIEHDLSKYAVRQKFTDAQFPARKPVGYSPFSLDRADYGLPQGSSIPSVDLRSANGQAASLKSLISGKNALVVVADADFHANAEMFKSIQSISRKIPDFRMVVISAKRDAASAKKIGVPNVYFDPTGAQLAKLQTPGVPAMYLVSKKGTIAQMFFGFDGHWEGLDQAIERLKKAG